VIRRLTSLQVDDFRCIAGSHKVPLDAQVVLVHGANGTGKSSLMQAIEYALTGEVGDLRRYEEDYPRCLANHFVDAGARSVLTAIDEAGTRIEFVSGSGGGLAVSSELGTYFRDRAFLSQAQLSRLFESYEEASPTDGEQPLVRFVQDLLQLDDLMNLSEGVSVSLDIRNLRKRCPRLEPIERLRDDLDVRLKQAEAERQKLEARQLQSVQQFNEQVEGSGIEGLRMIDATSELSVQLRSADEAAQHLSLIEDETAEFAGKLKNAASVLAEAEEALTDFEADVSELDKAVTKDREDAKRKLQDCEKTLSTLRTDLETTARTAALELGSLPGIEDDLAFFEGVERWVTESIAALETRRNRLAQIRSELSGLEQSLAAGELSAKKLSEQPDQDLKRVEELSALLASAEELIIDDVCPVCDLHYHGDDANLGRHVKEKMARLEDENRVAVERARQRREVEEKNERLRVQVSALKAEIAEGLTLDEATDRVSALERLLQKLEKSGEAREAVRSNLKSMSRAEQRLKSIEATSARMREAAGSLTGLCHELSIKLDDVAAPLPVLVDVVGRGIAELTEATDKRLEHANGLKSLLQDARSATEGRVDAARKAKALQETQAEISRRLTEVNKIRNTAREMADASSKTRAEALSRLIDHDLNGLWQDLFSRLVPAERFKPRLTTPEVRLRRLKVAAKVFAPDVDPLCAGSTLSAGNLNTAALCLFLSLNLIEATRLPVLVLDDPVQSMDDIHLVNFAALLAALARDAGRQLIVSAHEKPLYDYLMHELGPTREGDATLGLEIGHDSAGDWYCRETRKVWQPDKVLVG